MNAIPCLLEEVLYLLEPIEGRHLLVAALSWRGAASSCLLASATACCASTWLRCLGGGASILQGCLCAVSRPTCRCRTALKVLENLPIRTVSDPSRSCLAVVR